MVVAVVVMLILLGIGMVVNQLLRLRRCLRDSPPTTPPRRNPSHRTISADSFILVNAGGVTGTPSTLLVTDDGLPRGVSGAADPHFANVVKLFAQLFPGRRFGGGALCVYIDGLAVVDVWTGWSDRAGTEPWTADTGAMVFSATKGVASTVIHRLADRGLLSYDEPVAEYWPEFAANGKADITVRDVLRHRSGLSHLRGVTKTELMDHLLMEERLAAAPVDHLRGVQAYHALTYGWLLSGLARAVTGKGMRELIRQEVARPLNTDGMHLGRPPEGSPTKAAQILMPQGRLRAPVFNFIAPKVAGLPFSGALGAMYFPGVISLVKGDTPFLDGEVPGANGVVTGRGLAKMYAVLANDGRIDGKKYLSEELARGLTGQRDASGRTRTWWCPCLFTSATTNRRFPAYSAGSVTSVWVEPSAGPTPKPAAPSVSSTTGC